MKKFLRLIFVAAMFLAGCNGGGANTPDGYTKADKWPNSVINTFLGTTTDVVPDAKASSLFYREYQATDTTIASIDIMISGNIESNYVSILKDSNWSVSDTKDANYGYSAHDENKTASVDVIYLEKYGYTYIDIYRYKDVYPGGDDPLSSFSTSTIWPETQINNFLESEVTVPSLSATLYFYKTITSNPPYFVVAVEGDFKSSYITTLINARWTCLEGTDNTYIDPTELVKVMVSADNNYTYINIYNLEGSEPTPTPTPSDTNWPTKEIATFLGYPNFALPAATDNEVSYEAHEADGEYAAYFEIVSDEDLETSYTDILTANGYTIDDTYYDEYGMTAIDPDNICEVDYSYYQGSTYFYIYRYEDLYGGGGETSEYGTYENPLTTTEALAVAEAECLENYAVTVEPIYCYGEVTEFTDKDTYYKEVYITDGTTEILIYSLSYYDGYDMAVGDVIEIYGYMKLYNDTYEFATNGETYVEIVYYESQGGGDVDYKEGLWPTSEIATFLGTSFNVPSATNDTVYYGISEETEDYAAYFSIEVEGDLEDSYKTTLNNAGWTIDDTYYDYYGYCATDPNNICEVDFFAYDGYTYFYIYRYEDLYGGGGETSEYGTYENPLTTTEALAVAEAECLENYAVTVEPIYCYGEVTEFTDKDTYYKEVYITDGTTELLIYSLNYYDGYEIAVGDVIEIYGYMKLYNGTYEFATNSGTYVEIVYYESQGGGDVDYEEGLWPTSEIATFLGASIDVPSATNETVYYGVSESSQGYAAFFGIEAVGDLEDSYKATLTDAGWTIDDTYYDYYGYCATDPDNICEVDFYTYGESTFFCIYRYEDLYGGGEETVTDWPSETIAEFLGAGASTVPSFDADEYYVEVVDATEEYAAFVFIQTVEDYSADYFKTFQDLGWAYKTSQDYGYECIDQEHTVEVDFQYDEDYGFCVYIYRWSDLYDEESGGSDYGTISNEVIALGDDLNKTSLDLKNGNGYTDISKTINNHDYLLNINQTEDYIQVRAKSESGIINTTDNGVISSISVKWNTKSARTNNTYATIEIYASESPFDIADMYDGKEGVVLVCTLMCNTSCTITFNEDCNFKYFGIKGGDGAAYLDNIYIQYK